MAEKTPYGYINNPKIRAFDVDPELSKVVKKLFDEVQKQVEKFERPRQKGHNFAFAGLATCGECGAA